MIFGILSYFDAFYKLLKQNYSTLKTPRIYNVFLQSIASIPKTRVSSGNLNFSYLSDQNYTNSTPKSHPRQWVFSLLLCSEPEFVIATSSFFRLVFGTLNSQKNILLFFFPFLEHNKSLFHPRLSTFPLYKKIGNTAPPDWTVYTTFENNED